MNGGNHKKWRVDSKDDFPSADLSWIKGCVAGKPLGNACSSQKASRFQKSKPPAWINCPGKGGYSFGGLIAFSGQGSY
ncbi:MAG: hypothetical protein Q8R65_01280 [Polynucleobacter sp.]|nr:hypothetical protein [Polynucleobacter sp.]MDZ4057297.1 hypothetical protein [Polynucleobacter sp.]